MLSLNQFINLLKSLCAAHQQLKTFGEGNPWEIGASAPVQYPLLWVTPLPSSTSQKLLNMKFSLIFADIVYHDKSNEQEVLSDTLQMALDILAQLNTPGFADDFILDPVSQLSPFTEKFDDEVAGWKTDINIKINYLADRCAVPSNYETMLINPVNAPVIVKNSDGSFTASFDAGSTNTLADVVITDGMGTTHIVPAVKNFTVPACPAAGVINSDNSYSATIAAGGHLSISDSALKNSDTSWTHNLPATESYTIPDSAITDSDGSAHNLPATKAFVAKTLQQLINLASVSTLRTDMVTAGNLNGFIQALQNADLDNLTNSQLDYIVTLLATEQVQLLSTPQISNLSSAQVAEIANGSIPYLTNTQLAYLNTSQLNAITALLGSVQIALLTNTQVSNLTSTQIQALTNSQIANLSTAQVQALTNTQIGYLSSAQVKALVNSQLANLSSTQLQYILSTLMSNQFLQDHLSISQRNSLNEIYTLQTGQTTSYATGDDGDLKHGRLTDFFTLKTNNVFGNTHRFTDENGNQTYSSNYVIDHATGLGWCTVLQGTTTWATAISNANGFSLSTGASTLNGFFLPDVNEYLSIFNFGLNNQYMNYLPFNQTSQNTLFTSTTFAASTTNVFRMTNGASVNIIAAIGKSTNQFYFLSRRHF